MYKSVVLILAVLAAMVTAQTGTLINIIQFSDDYCLCPNEQHISVVDLCVPVIGGYSVYRLVDGTPDTVVIQTCSDSACTTCTNTTTYNTHPPCQTETDGIAYYSVLPENDPTTYYNAPSVVTVRFPYKNCSGDALHVDIAYGLSCFPTEAGGSFYYECPSTTQSEYYVYNCSDSACLEECTPTIFQTEQCTDDEGVFKSVYCTPSTSTSTTQTTQTSVSTSQTSTTNDNTVSTGQTASNTMASATVSTTTSASSHNVSSSASAANGGTSASSTSGGSAAHLLFSDVRGGHMRRKAPRSNPPFCNGGLPSTSSTSTSSDATATSNDATATSATSGTAGTAGTAGTGGSSGGSGGSSGGRGIKKIFINQ